MIEMCERKREYLSQFVSSQLTVYLAVTIFRHFAFFGWKVVPYLRLCLDRFTTKIRKFVTNYVRRLHLDKLHALQILLLLPPLLFSYQTGNFSSNYQAGIVFLRYMFLKSPAFIAMQEKLSIFAPPHSTRGHVKKFFHTQELLPSCGCCSNLLDSKRHFMHFSVYDSQRMAIDVGQVLLMKTN